ncbi:enoyl-CoA hydratase, putative [Plasmodium gaboni]|uniref:Enoyl-CoA hydratase, putative n=1 Tax=Plasmodium gaboni TaxID=647221 RepID=A0ABY1UUF1_9APIC|nr:enoyl-CoA hydratase, putative [Plasmodium gaboni]
MAFAKWLFSNVRYNKIILYNSHVNCKKKKTCSYLIKRYINTQRGNDITSSVPSEKDKIFDGDENINMKNPSVSDNKVACEEERQYFMNHKYVDFFRDESRNIGLITFKNMNEKKNIFYNFLEELKNVLEHVNNIISNEENNTFYIKEFKNKENYLIKNIKNCIPYYDNKLKILIIHSVMDNNIFLNSLDYNSYLKNDEDTNVEISNTFRFLCNTIQQLPIITISNINGLCLNSGIDLILSTDFKISKENSLFGFDKMHIGLYPYGGSCQKLFRHIPINYAKYLLLTNKIINAQDALKINLIDICIKKNKNFFIQNSNIYFEQNLSNEQIFSIIKQNIINYFKDIFQHHLFQKKMNDDSFIFTLFYSFQFLFIPTYILQNIKLGITEGLSFNDVNSYLDYDKHMFEKCINSTPRLDILNYIKKKKNE